jgi:hypothetical protein
LEATSLIHSILQLKRFFSDPLNIECRNEGIIKKFNKMYQEDAEEIVDYIQIHYLGSTKDGIFWKEFALNHDISDFVKEIISISSYRQPNYDDFDKKNIFKLKSYLPILHGLNLISHDAILNSLSTIDNSKYTEFINIRKNHKIFENLCLSHNDFIEEVKESS